MTPGAFPPVREGLLRDVCEHPDDDTPRLVYADWLDEHGDPDRAEFIRVQVEAERLPGRGPRRKQLLARAGQLQAAHGREWLAELPAFGGASWGPAFRRGFVEEATFAGWQAFAANAERLFAAAPLRRAKFTALRRADGRRMAGSPLLERLRGLEGYVGELGAPGAQSLLRSPHLANLTSLHLRGELDEGLADVIAGALTASPWPVGLTELALARFSLGDRGARALAGRPALAGITSLALAHCLIGAGGAATLAASPHRTGLMRLRLDANYVGDEGAAALARSNASAGLEVLCLVSAGVGWEGIRALAGSPHLAGLRELWLGGSSLGPSGVGALMASPFLAGLTFLDLSHTDIGPAGARRLAESPGLPDLERLRLSGVGWGGAWALLTAQHRPRLQLCFPRE